MSTSKPTRSDYIQKIADDVALLSVGRYTPRFIPHSRLTKENLRIISKLIGGPARSQQLPRVMHERARRIAQPNLTLWLSYMEQHYDALKTCGLGKYVVGDELIAECISGLLMLKQDETGMPEMTSEQELHYMILVIAAGWSNLDHLIYATDGPFSGDRYLWEQDVLDFAMRCNRKELDLVFRALTDRTHDLQRFTEVVALLEDGIAPALVEGAL